ncbi:MAG: 16S rRNA (guanine(527)-N(7))-methyltransferase RsmG [Desulfocucumaceae bacterium]
MTGVLEKHLEAGLSQMGIETGEKDLALYREYYQILKEENSKYNLTSLEGEAEVAVKHFIDSLSCVQLLDLKGKHLVDIGAGAGFPGIPLKIYCPEMDLLLVDSVKKKVGFLQGLVVKLGLNGVEARWDRAETMGRSEAFRERADIVVSRAVAPLNVLSELCLPLVKPGGAFLAMKGPGAGEELAAASRAIALLGGEIERLENIRLPVFNDERNLILIRKVAPTPPEYPRREGVPAKRPL